MKICPKCTAQNPDDARFCTSCGAGFVQAPPRQEMAQPAEGQQKQAAAKPKIPRRIWVIVAVAVVILILAAVIGFVVVYGKLTATTMHLMKTEGTVDISTEEGASVTPKENLKLYSGYGVDTKPVSYAWINLDDVKLVKMDERSEVEIQKDGKKLELLLNSGNLFFNVKEPLADDETMTIRTSTMAVGIRGTCGWVVSRGDQGAQVFILEGAVEAEAVDTGETVQASAGEMAEITVNEDGKTEITVLPFVEEYIAPFVLAELEEDPDLSGAVLEASGLDALNPPDPAERLREEYQEIIAGYPIFDNGANASYLFNGVTYDSKGLSDAVLADLNGDGLDELILLTRKWDDWWEDPGVCIRIEIYGSVMGKAALYDSMTFDEADYSYMPKHFQMVSRDGRPCIYMYCGYQAVEEELLWALENNKLTLIERASGYSPDSIDRTDLAEEAYTVLELPPLPTDAQRRNAFLDILSLSYAPPIFARLTGEGENMELYALDAFNLSFSKYGTGLRQWTELETGIEYAKLIDMDQDGTEELLLIGANDEGEIEYEPNVVVYSWDDSEISKTNLEITTWGGYMGEAQDGLYRDKTTGDIYVGTSWWGGAGTFWEFASLTDFVSLEWNNPYFDSDGLTPEELDARREEFERQAEESDAQIERFELLEQIYLDPDSPGYSTAWVAALGHTVEEVEQQLRER